MMKDCDSCRSAPASVYCEADSASLCSACDAEIHSANFISHRHHRVPVIGMEEYNEGEQSNYAALFGEEVDEYLDLVELGSCEEKKSGLSFECVKSEVSEGVVPVQSLVVNEEMKEDYESAMRHGVSFLSSISFSFDFFLIKSL